MNYFNYPEEELKTLGGYQTALKINQQPVIWKETASKFFEESNSIQLFLQKAQKEIDQILLVGAGSSSFVGLSLYGFLFKHFKKPCYVVPTTDIVTFPEHCFNKDNSVLIISLARSGESPESMAALKLTDKCSKKCFHLIITYNSPGDLAGFQSHNPIKVFNLPKSTNDKGLAMTGSYTSMLLTGLLVSIYYENKEIDIINQLANNMKMADDILKKHIEMLKSLAQKEFKRAVFLGSGPLFGTATEAALKLQELSNGHVICKSDTFLGFRHGPKTVINEETLVVCYQKVNMFINMKRI